MGHFQQPPSYPARIRLRSRKRTLASVGALEDDIVWTIAHLVWRKEKSCNASNCGVANPSGEIPPSIGRIARNDKFFRGTTRGSAMKFAECVFDSFSSLHIST